MAMYVQLLRTALGDRRPSGRSASTGRLLNDAVRCRDRLVRELGPKHGVGWAAGAVARQVAYDAALVRLCERLGVAVDLAAFDRPDRERERLEGALAELGVMLGGLDQEASG